MPSYCHVTLVGNVTRDVELRTVGEGTKVCDLGVAYNKRRKSPDGEGYEDEAHFFDVTLWGNTAQVAADYLKKGSPVLIEGELAQDRWEQDGQKRSKVKIVGRKMVMLGQRTSEPDAEPESAKPGTEFHSDGQLVGRLTSMADIEPTKAPEKTDEIPF